MTSPTGEDQSPQTVSPQSQLTPQATAGRPPLRVWVGLVTLLGALVIWILVSAAGTIRETARLRSTLSPGHVRDFEAVGETLADAERTLGRLRAYSTPFRLVPWFWGLSPVRGGDASQIRDVIEYADAVLAPVSRLYGTAEHVRGAFPVSSAARGSPTQGAGTRSGGSPDLDLATLREIAARVEASGPELAVALAELRHASTIGASIERDRLSQGSRDAFDRVEALREALETVVQVATELTPVVAEMEALLAAVEVDSSAGTTSGNSQAGNSAASNSQDAPAPPEKAEKPDKAVKLERLASVAAAVPDLANRLRSSAAVLGPYLGLDTRDTEAVLDYGVRLSRPLEDLVREAIEAGEIMGAGLPRDATSATRLEGVLASLASSASDARIVTSAGDRPEIGGGVLDALGGRLRQVELASVVARDLLGFNGARRILVLGQDDEELRPTGGFIGAVWELELERGQLVRSRVLSSYAVDESLPVERWMPAPADFAVSFGAGVVPFRDQNWWPDFRYSAARLRETYELGVGTRPETVIAVNQRSLELIVAALGAVDLPGGQQVDAAALRGFLRDGVEPGVVDSLQGRSDLDPRRYAAQVLGEGMIGRVRNGGEVDLLRLAKNLNQAITAGDLLIDVEKQPARTALRSLGWDGAVPAFDDDGFYWVDANAYSPKISGLIDRSIVQRVTIQPDGSADTTLTIHYRNLDERNAGDPSAVSDSTASGSMVSDCRQASADGAPACYWFYGRLILPGAAKVVESPQFPLPGGATSSGRSASGGPDVFQPGRSTARIDPSGEHVEVSGLAVVPEGATGQWTFHYRLPGASRQLADGTYRYSTRVERQPGAPPISVTLEVRVPERACVPGVEGSPAIQSFGFPLERDTVIEVNYVFGSACAI